MTTGLEGKARYFVTEERGKISVDWKALAELKDRASSTPEIRKFERIFDELLIYLDKKSILVFADTPGSYFASDSNVNLHPYSDNRLGSYSFVNKQDAIEYYRHFFRTSTHPIVLHQTIEDIEIVE